MKMYIIPNDIREKVIAEIKGGAKVADAAAKFNVNLQWVYKIWARYKKTGSYEALPFKGPRKIKGERLTELKNLMKENPNASLREVIEKGHFNMSTSGLSQMLRREKIVNTRSLWCRKEAWAALRAASETDKVGGDKNKKKS